MDDLNPQLVALGQTRTAEKSGVERRIIDVLHPDYDDPKEPYAFFGLAAYWAQCFEQSMILLIASTNALLHNPIEAKNFDEVFSSLDKKTLGTLIRQLSGIAKIESGMEFQINSVLQKRNYLMHRFFSENSMMWFNSSTRRKMIDELRDLAQAFQDGDHMLTSIYNPLWERLGIDEATVRRELENMKQFAAEA